MFHSLIAETWAFNGLLPINPEQMVLLFLWQRQDLLPSSVSSQKALVSSRELQSIAEPLGRGLLANSIGAASRQ
jgi:hypothetical protein